jgi:hypothetical protein
VLSSERAVGGAIEVRRQCSGDRDPLALNPTRAVSGPDQPFVKSNVVISNEASSGHRRARQLKGVIIVFRTHLALSALALGALLAAAAPANASLTFNAITLNALVANGLQLNSLTTNAIIGNALSGNALTSNALSTNALTNNALAGNALASNGILHNSLTHNALSFNAVVAVGSALGELNGVAVEAVVLPNQPSR